MRIRVGRFWALLVLVAPAASYAQQGSVELPPMHVETETEKCVDVEIGGVATFDCLNKKLEGTSKAVPPLNNISPIDGRAPDIRKGIVNVPALRQQYGPNFGNSVVPYRPDRPSYAPLR